MVPKIIHHILFTDDDGRITGGGPVPQQWWDWEETWRVYNPGFEFQLWNEEAADYLMQSYPVWYKYWQQLPHRAAKMDAFRYALLYDIGGVYVDMDYECLKPLVRLINFKESDFVLTTRIHPDQEQFDKDRFGTSLSLAPGFLISPRKNPFMEYLWEGWIIPSIEDGSMSRHPMLATGPAMFTKAYETYQFPLGQALYAFPYQLTCPTSHNQSWSDLSRSAKKRAYAVHHWAGTWIRENDDY